RPPSAPPKARSQEKGERVRRLRLSALLTGICAVVVLCASAATGSDSARNAKITAAGTPSGLVQAKLGEAAAFSGPVQFRRAAASPSGTNITECPQAGMNTEPEPLSLIEPDQVWRERDRGDDTRAKTEFSCLPQNETTIAVNPTNPRNVIGAQNDYRLGGSFSGVDATTDAGHHWFDRLHIVPSVQNGDMLDSSGDPALAFDREGTPHLQSLVFNRPGATNGIWVNRSTNGGFSWSRPCVPIG